MYSGYFWHLYIIGILSIIFHLSYSIFFFRWPCIVTSLSTMHHYKHKCVNRGPRNIRKTGPGNKLEDVTLDPRTTTWKHKHTHKHTHTRTHTHTHSHSHTHTHRHVLRTHTYTLTHTCTHKHTLTQHHKKKTKIGPWEVLHVDTRTWCVWRDIESTWLLSKKIWRLIPVI
jgi:hypothetical protein